MGDLGKGFNRAEFACPCGCGFDTVDTELMPVLQDVREQFGQPVTINSGCRCPQYNRSVGGALSSQHLKGRAADITVKDVPPSIVQQYLLDKYSERLGIGEYMGFTHIDTRTGRARWSG